MLPPSANSGPLSDVFKAKVTSLIKEQLKPIVTELAAQQQTLLTHIALLKHNHNVNDYQMTRLENIRDLEQSINFKVSGVLGFDPWQHPTMGTNLREPVPADPRLIPQFTPISKATPAERAAVSAALVKEAGMSARQIGVPLSFHDFPDHPSMSGGGKKEDPMHASNPLFGLNAPRWRAMQGLEEHGIPGTAAWDGVVALPVEKKAQQLYQRHAKQLKRPMWKLIEQGADPLGIGAASSSSSPGAGTGHSDVPDVAPVGTSPFNMTTPAARPPPSSTPSSSSTPPMRRALFRTYAISDIESTSNNAPRTSSLRRTSTMATIGSTTSEVSSLSRVSTTATIGSEPDLSSLLTTTTKSKAKAKKKQPIDKQRDTRTKTAARPSPSPPSSSSTAPEQPKHAATLKRGRGTAELDDATTTAGGSDTDADGDINISQPWAETNQEKEDEEGAEPARKRRKPSPKRNTSSDGDGQETGQGQQPRRSTRVTRASAAAAVPKPAARGRATKGKKANKRS